MILSNKLFIYPLNSSVFVATKLIQDTRPRMFTLDVLARFAG